MTPSVSALFQSVVVASSATATLAFVTSSSSQPSRAAVLNAEKPVGIFYGTSTGSTGEAAYAIAAEFGPEVAAGPFEIDEYQGSVAEEFAKYDSLVVGTPTWNTGADMERSGTGWDEIYYSEMQDLNIAGKKVAVFGLGDSVSYSENYGDATGELHDVFEKLGCKMMGYTSQEGYLHDESKSIRGDLFCGLLLDAVNQEEMTEERVQKWVAQLKSEGILEGGGAAADVNGAGGVEVADVPVTEVSAASPTPKIEVSSVPAVEVESVIQSGYVAHYNPRTDKTMWISTDGRSSYVTAGEP